MADEVFRPERKPISHAEIKNSHNIQQTFNDIENVRKAAASPESDGRFQQQPTPDAPGLQIGNIQNAPPEFLQRLAGVNQEDDSPNFTVRESTMNRPRQKKLPAEQPNMRVTGSSKLEALLEGTKEATNIYEKIQLPSLGKFYDGEDGPTDGVIHIRQMTGEEEQILATPRFIKRGTAINMIFNRCMREKYNSENFLSVDRTFLLIWLRGISYSPDYDVEVTCPYTDKKFTTTIDLNLDVETCPDEFSASNLVGVLPTTGYNFTYRLASGADEQRVQDYRDKKSKFDNAGQSDDTLLYRTALLVEDIEGLTDKRELQVLLKKLPISDVSHLRNLTNEPPFGVNTKVTITSPFNMEDFEIDLPLEANFFFPRQRKTQTQV